MKIWLESILKRKKPLWNLNKGDFMKIYRMVENNPSWSDNKFYFIGEDSYMKFYQKPSFDLAFTVSQINESDKNVFTVSKEENPMVYDLITKMLSSMGERKVLRDYKTLNPFYQDLFENGYFSWKSDAPSFTYDESVVYNYLNIIPADKCYNLVFIKNTDTPFYTVEVNTDRSRYGNLVFDVQDFFNDLEKACETLDSSEELRNHIRKLIK